MSDTGRALSPGTAPKNHSANGSSRGPERVKGIQRGRMLAAMAEVCAERGVSNVTVSHVVSRSGVSRRTFYEMFEDREACFLATLDEALACVARYVLPAYETPARWHERIRASLVGLLSFLEDEPYMGRMLIVETLGFGTLGLQRRKEVLVEVVAAVDEGRLVAKNGAGLPPLTADGLAGGVLSVIHSRLLEPEVGSLLELTGPLMSMIVLPYLGAAAARGELARSVPVQVDRRERSPADPLRDVEMRLTYRTVRVLASIASQPGASNREIGWASGMQDQGQISKLLTRLSKLGLIENVGIARARGAPNAWTLTEKGAEIEAAIGNHAS